MIINRVLRKRVLWATKEELGKTCSAIAQTMLYPGIELDIAMVEPLDSSLPEPIWKSTS